MAALWNRAGHIYFHPVVCFFFLLFSSPTLSHHRLDVCMWLAENTGRKKVAKKSSSGHHIAQLCRAISSQLRHVSTIGKKSFKKQYVLQMSPYNMVNFGPLAAEIGLQVWGPQLISTAFASWQRYCMAVNQWVSAKLCGVEQRAPPMLDRAAITLGTGPHF